MRVLATTVGDARGHLLGKLRDRLPELARRFDAISTSAITLTPKETTDLLAVHGPVIRYEPSSGHIGRHRRQAVAHALSLDADHVVYLDLDHVLRWVERAPLELDEVLARTEDVDCLVIGRSQRSLDLLPRRLYETERLVNHVFGMVTGRQWDVMMAARGLSRAAATTVVERCREDSIANDVTWPLLCIREGHPTGYAEADGLTYETNVVYGKGEPDVEDADPGAWIRRMQIAATHASAMQSYL